MVPRKDHRTDFGQILKTFNLDTTVQRDLIKPYKRNRWPALGPHLAGTWPHRYQEDANRRCRQQAEQRQVACSVFPCECLFDTRNAAADGFRDLPRMLYRHWKGLLARKGLLSGIVDDGPKNEYLILCLPVLYGVRTQIFKLKIPDFLDGRRAPSLRRTVFPA
ncbi:MAG: hypothetical protein DMG13_23925 [Acidobacteria bacterium]|nr:MAG: hypothetical protein DMG13_23925 [Acidobacteriota bacterium]